MQTSPLYTFTVLRDGELQKEFTDQENDQKVFGWMLDHQSDSVTRALRHEGWKIIVTDQQTGQQTDYLTRKQINDDLR